MADYNDILRRAIQVRDAVLEGSNTASLVGGVMVDSLYLTKGLISDINNIIISLKALGATTGSGSGGGGSIDESQLLAFLISHGYAKKTDIPSSWWGQEKNSSNVVVGGLTDVVSILFQGETDVIDGIANESTSKDSNTKIVTPKYINNRFLSKLTDDIANGTITFEKVQKFVQGFFIGNNNDFSIDGNGNAILSSVMLKVLKSIGFNESEQSGFAIRQRSDGKYQILATDLIVWGKAIFNTLLIRELSYVGGNIVLSPAAGKISYIKEVFSETTNELIGWKCYLLADDGTTATINSFKVDDQVRCKTFNIKAGVYENVSNKDYWRLVTKVSTENEAITDSEGHELYDGKKFAWIQIAKDNCMEGSDNPAAGDTIVIMGNRSDKTRQHLLMMETEGDSAPTFTMYRGINFYTLKGKSIFDVGINGINIVSKYYHMTTVDGEKIWTPIYRGDWKEGTEYDYYDEVTWMGTRWLCLVSDGQTTTAEPSEDSPYWKATTAILKIKLQLYHDLSAGICRGETHTVVCRLMLGDKDVTTAVKSWAVSRKTDDAADDIAWSLKDKVRNFKGSLDITWANDNSEDDLGRGDVASFTFTATTNTGDVHKAILDL